MTWSEPAIITKGTNPVGVAGNDGKLWLMYFERETLCRDGKCSSKPVPYLRLSTDDGVSWSNKKVINIPGVTPIGEMIINPPGLSANSTRGTVAFDYSNSGQMVIYFAENGPSETASRNFLTTSEDYGETWTQPLEVAVPDGLSKYGDPAGYIIGVESVAFMDSGEIWAVSHVRGIDNPTNKSSTIFGDSYYEYTYSGIAYNSTSDNGETWSEWKLLDRPAPAPGYGLAGNTTFNRSFKNVDVDVSSSGQVAIVAGGEDDERSIWYKFEDPAYIETEPFRRFSSYLGKNEVPKVAALPDGNFGIIWLSGTTEKSDGVYEQRPSVRYGVFDHFEDIKSPPVLGNIWPNTCMGNHNCPLSEFLHYPGNPSASEKVLFKVKVADHDNVAEVKVLFSIDGIEQSPLYMTDDRKFNDNKGFWDTMGSEMYGTRVYGVERSPFTSGSIIKYHISATDILGNTVIFPVERSTIEIPSENPFVREIDVTGVTLKASSAELLKSWNEYDVSMEHDATDQNKSFYWYYGVSRTDSDSQGNLFVLVNHHDYLGNEWSLPQEIKKYDTNGSLMKIFKVDDLDAPPYATTTASGKACTPGPHDMAIDGQGNIYVTDNCVQAIHKLTSEGVYIETYSSPCGISYSGEKPALMTIHKDSGAIYMSSQYIGTIKLDTSGNCDQDFSSQASPARNGNIAVDSDGNLYVSVLHWNTDQPNGTGPVIYKFGPDGKKMDDWGYIGDNDEEFSGKQHSLISLAVSKNGFLYASDSGKGEIKKFTTDGTFVSKWEGNTVGGGIPQDGYFSRPHTPSASPPDLHISIDDSTGNIYVSDSYNGHDTREHKKRVQVFSPF